MDPARTAQTGGVPTGLAAGTNQTHYLSWHRDKNTDADSLCDDERIYYLGDANFNITTLVSTASDAVERYGRVARLTC